MYTISYEKKKFANKMFLYAGQWREYMGNRN